MKYHIAAFVCGFILDLLFGDPPCLPHPVRGIGNLTAGLEKRLLGSTWDNRERKEKRELISGILLVFLVVSVTVFLTAFCLILAYSIHPYLGVLAESVMTYQILAARCLKEESMKVYRNLREGSLAEARKSLSMIVGRDTGILDEEGVAKAAIETVAENTSDGVTAPMLYTALGGPVLGLFYKAVNTMDSMVGYKSEKYLYFGRAAAKLDDVLNYIPSRISAYLMILAAFLLGKDFHGRRAYAIYKRDRRNHASPNSAQTESVCAGALGLRLGGDASYFGRTVQKPYIGDALRKAEYEDIRRANKLMYLTAYFCEFLCLVLMIGAAFILEGKW
ncbi:MAG: adenosylcobinamide-phosphate synthase CbiB [Clostridium sp.]|nr:adenosylcobinamide-phosphate synthase CbiB [Clostridium sp.]